MLTTGDARPPRSRIARLTAPNPSPMTLEGTNSYVLLGDGEALVIDPGPADAAHVTALRELASANGCDVTAIAVTHGHSDHAPGAVLLRAQCGAPVYAHPAAEYPHDVALADGSHVGVDGIALRAIHSPGHARDHLAFWFAPERALFTGDAIVGRGTVVIAPPDGDMRAYQATLCRLRAQFAAAQTIFGGHGEPVTAPRAKIDEYIAHRELRERQLLQALANGERTIPELVARLYADVDRVLRPAAARQVLAYLHALEREGRVRTRTLARAPREDEREVLEPSSGAALSRIDAYALATG